MGQFHARVGTISAADASVNPLATNKQGYLLAGGAGGKLTQAVQDKRVFSVASQAAVATTAALATTWTGLGITNPATSSKNLILHQFGWALTVVGSDEGGVGLMTGPVTGMADNLTIQNAFDADTTGSSAIADDGATIGTPILRRIYGTYGTGAISTAMLYAPTIVDLDGSWIIPAGRSVLTYTTTATTAAFVFYFLWEEITA